MYGMLFENVFEYYIPLLGNIDEGIAVLIILMGLLNIVKYKKRLFESKHSLNILIALLFIILIGIAGNLIYKYQYISFAFKEIFTFRGILCYAMIPIIFYDFKLEDYKKMIKINIKLITIVLFILVISNYFVDIFPYYEIRFGIKSQQLFFTHPTYLVVTSSIILALLSIYIDEDKKTYIYMGMITVVIISTLRTKAIMFLVAYIYLLFIVVIRKRKLSIIDIIILGLIAVGMGISEVREYLQNPDWARSAISINSLDIAKNHLPFGSGFGTFGTWISGVNYSPLYFNYDMQTIWGLAPDYYNFVSDTFWPMILAQFGFIGLIIMGYIIVKIYTDIKDNENIYYYLGQMTILAYLITASIGEPSFTGPQSLILFMVIGLLGINRRR